MSLKPSALPDFPWDALEPLRALAASHPDGIVDLSVGTPVDPSPAVIREALITSANAPGYPTTHGTSALREAIGEWFARMRRAPGLDPRSVLPTIGSKEFIASLPALLGLGEGDVVVIPEIAYPTYDVGARLVGATTLATDDVSAWEGRRDVRLIWVNSPSNPTGAVASAADLARIVEAARAIGALVASDECYAELAWDEPYASGGVPSILDPAVCGGSHDGVLAVYSLSKRSNLAGYRAAFAAGDQAVIAALLETRKHMGMILPTPIQAAMAAALADDRHVAAQRALYGSRRQTLLEALGGAGFSVSHSHAGLYLWATAGEDCWLTLGRLAELGILAAPGSFYGATGARHVRVALTATDERVSAGAQRLGARR